MDGSRGTECSGEKEPTRKGGGGLITPLRGTRRGADPQEPGIGRRQLLGIQVDTSALGLRKGICEGHLGDVSTPSQGKLLPAIARGFLG